MYEGRCGHSRRTILACWPTVVFLIHRSCLIKKNTHRDTRVEVLGWIVDTEWLTVTLPSHTRLKLYPLLLEWPPSRAYVSATQVAARCPPHPYLIRVAYRGFPSCHVFWPRSGWRA